MLRLLLLSLGLVGAILATAGPSLAGVTSYCPGAPNSAGPGAVLAWRGPADPDQAMLVVDGLPAGAPLLYVYGLAPQQTPFGNGTLCVGPSTFVLARSRADAGGAATLWIAQEGEQEDLRWLRSGLLSGATFQVLYRDGGSVGALANTTNALAVVFE